MLETRMGGVRDIVQELGLPHVLCFQVSGTHAETLQWQSPRLRPCESV